MTFHHLSAELALVLRVLLRQPGFWVPTVLFPAMLYSFFGAGLVGQGPAAAYAMASFAVYAVLGVGFYQFGVTVAQDRADPFIRWQRLLPGAALAPWAARVLAAIGFSALALLLVLALGKVLGGVVLADASAWARLVVVTLLAALPATLMGMALGALVSARAAVPLANLVFFPLACLGGLWMPPHLLPDAVAAFSVWTPTRAMAELAWAALNGRALPLRFLGVLTFWTAFAAGISATALARQNRAQFGEPGQGGAPQGARRAPVDLSPSPSYPPARGALEPDCGPR